MNKSNRVKLRVLLDRIVEQVAAKKLNESNIKSIFPTTLTFTKEIWNIGIRQDIGSGDAFQSKNYHSYSWSDREDKYNSTDFINRGVVMMLDPKSVEHNYAEYKPIGGGSKSIRGFTPEDIESFRSLKAINESVVEQVAAKKLNESKPAYKKGDRGYNRYDDKIVITHVFPNYAAAVRAYELDPKLAARMGDGPGFGWDDVFYGPIENEPVYFVKGPRGAMMISPERWISVD